MVFSSPIFLFIFLPVTLAVYYLIPKALRNAFLLVMSLGFYAWGEPRFILVMLISITANYLLGLCIDSCRRKQPKGMQRGVLVVALCVNLGILAYYKYFDFAVSSLNAALGTQIPLRSIALPIGISFFTFQSLSYIIDLYRGKVPVQKNPLHIALYISLFPQLIAGPIVRYIDVNRQITERKTTLEGFTYGIWRFSVGLAKKTLLANTAGQVVDAVFAIQPSSLQVGTAWLGAVCYAVQIYFDFSGYSDMAIGLGHMFGFDFHENFNYPYISTSITEFWRRWHISLSSWFRDYLYIPLGGSRRGNVYINLCIVFLITGLWHGAAWTFVLWGLWHGAFILVERFYRNRGGQLGTHPVIGWLYTSTAVLLGWVLFRSDTLGYAVQYVGRMFGLVPGVAIGYTLGWYLTPKIAAMLACAVIAGIPLKLVFKRPVARLEGTTGALVARNVWAALLLAASTVMVMTSTYNPFIYFRF